MSKTFRGARYIFFVAFFFCLAFLTHSFSIPKTPLPTISGFSDIEQLKAAKAKQKKEEKKRKQAEKEEVKAAKKQKLKKTESANHILGT